MSKLPMIAAVDIGTGSIKAIVVTPEDSGFRVLGMAENISSGVRKGVVADVDKVSKTIANTIKEASRESACDVQDVYVNINGSHISSISSRGLVSISRADQKISQEEIDRAVEAAKAFSLPSNREILEVIPREFIVDKEGGIKDPLGLQGVRLETEILAISVFSRYSKDLIQSIINADLQVSDLVIGPVAAARAVLTQEEKEQGVAVVDIGAGTTGLAVFEEGELLHTAVIPVGMDNMRNDIAIGLRINMETAEFIKNKYGISILEEKKTRIEKIKTPQGEDIVFQRSDLKKIMEARAVEMFEQINTELKKVSRYQKLPAGVVLTGGGAKFAGITDFAKEKMKLNCRIGYPRRFSSLEDDPSLSVLCGLVLHGFDEENEDSFVDIGSLKGVGKKIKKILKTFMP